MNFFNKSNQWLRGPLRGKKGEMTTQQIVILIVMIASFAVILFFLLKLDLGQKSEKEICHNSVVTRGNSALPSGTYPLNCKRSYVCITADGTCEDMLYPIEKKVKTKNETYQVLAEELADCWWVFGEGEVNYVGKESIPKRHCSICSQVVFDNSVIDKNLFGGQSSFAREELYDYLEKTEYVEGQSYLNYLKKVNKVSEIATQDFGRINLTKPQYIFMGRVADLNAVAWGALGGSTVITGVVAGVVALVAAPLTIPALVTIGVVGGAVGAYTEYQGSYISSFYEGPGKDNFLLPDIMEANSDKWEDLDCDVIDTFN